MLQNHCKCHAGEAFWGEPAGRRWLSRQNGTPKPPLVSNRASWVARSCRRIASSTDCRPHDESSVTSIAAYCCMPSVALLVLMYSLAIEHTLAHASQGSAQDSTTCTRDWEPQHAWTHNTSAPHPFFLHAPFCDVPTQAWLVYSRLEQGHWLMSAYQLLWRGPRRLPPKAVPWRCRLYCQHSMVDHICRDFPLPDVQQVPHLWGVLCMIKVNFGLPPRARGRHSHLDGRCESAHNHHASNSWKWQVGSQH